jgi:hypothetical protein
MVNLWGPINHGATKIQRELTREALLPRSAIIGSWDSVAAAQAAAWGNSTAMRFGPLVSTIATRILLARADEVIEHKA